jgi:hypothetical protein
MLFIDRSFHGVMTAHLMDVSTLVVDTPRHGNWTRCVPIESKTMYRASAMPMFTGAFEMKNDVAPLGRPGIASGNT